MKRTTVSHATRAAAELRQAVFKLAGIEPGLICVKVKPLNATSKFGISPWPPDVRVPIVATN